ncbi:hypothetical protein KJ780_02055 [Candidatus Micrarchaeota archaeon]|nr:hypothetical protein [Candidatus Micrarchaeota archaeon]
MGALAFARKEMIPKVIPIGRTIAKEFAGVKRLIDSKFPKVLIGEIGEGTLTAVYARINELKGRLVAAKADVGSGEGTVVGLVVDVMGDFKGRMWSILGSDCEGTLNGSSVSLSVSSIADLAGWMMSPLNICDSFKGFMFGGVNVSKYRSRGLQVGLVNVDMTAPFLRVMPFAAIRGLLGNGVGNNKTYVFY